MPETSDILFSIKDITYSPVSPCLKEAFTVKGKVELFKISYIVPIWAIVTVTYPETWWEEIIPIWGSPNRRESDVAIGGNFEVNYPGGFEREGKYTLSVRLYAGPTMPINALTLPPFPAVATVETTFTVTGELPAEELGFRNFKIISYGKNGGTPVKPPAVLSLNVGDKCRVNLSFEHRNGAVTGKFRAAIGNLHTLNIFDEILAVEAGFSVPASADWKAFTSSIDIGISTIETGNYSLYSKIKGITGGEILTPFYEKVLNIGGAPPPEVPAGWNLVAQVTGIVVNPAAVAPPEVPAGWNLVAQVTGIVVNPPAAPTPAPYTVSFGVVATGFPLLTAYWYLYYYDPFGGGTYSDGQWHGVNDEIKFSGVPYQGYFICYCVNYAGQTLGPFESSGFLPSDGGRYEYNIDTGEVNRLY